MKSLAGIALYSAITITDGKHINRGVSAVLCIIFHRFCLVVISSGLKTTRPDSVNQPFCIRDGGSKEELPIGGTVAQICWYGWWTMQCPSHRPENAVRTICYALQGWGGTRRQKLSAEMLAPILPGPPAAGISSNWKEVSQDYPS
jgi:hypothetical protein